MPVAVVGVSHRTAPVEVRERFAIPGADAAAVLDTLRSSMAVEEAVLLSTCNRTEFYVYPVGEPRALHAVHDLMAAKAGPLSRPVAEYVYELTDREAVRHLFRVAAGLDSLVMGESEIQGQVRDAYRSAVEAGREPPFAGTVLARLFQDALSVGGRVRAETALGEGAASVASVAVALAGKIFGSLAPRRVLVLGAGSTAEQVVDALGREGVEDVSVVSRTYSRAADLARRVRGRALELRELSQALRSTDIVVASTAAPHPVLRPPTFREAFPSGPSSPLLIIDIAIPRDVDPDIGLEPNVFLYNIDDLRFIIDENLHRRTRAVVSAEGIVDEQTEGFVAWFAGLEVVPVIRALRLRAEEVRRAEVDRAMARLGRLEDDERERIHELSRRLVNKLLHPPSVRLREGAADGRGEELVEAARFLYALDEASEIETDSPPQTSAESGEESPDSASGG